MQIQHLTSPMKYVYQYKHKTFTPYRQKATYTSKES
nr:unnamed protein product [Callosobruchus chinensis]CAH7717119.1 unnamed protein product [Callosobruchus chinensis]CAH7730231.1 unnamed protein product [Callosobruchus chinensis]CAH7732132.1 unnamed protein product [Callosobruchus chinensis]CAH7733276.1 unnamed protein product [Callosobruchus chinensis]